MTRGGRKLKRLQVSKIEETLAKLDELHAKTTPPPWGWEGPEFLRGLRAQLGDAVVPAEYPDGMSVMEKLPTTRAEMHATFFNCIMSGFIDEKE